MSTTSERASWVNFEPKGFRDVYWCGPVNEPMVLEYRGDTTYCPLCKREDVVGDEGFGHAFICHVVKPYGAVEG